MNYLCLIVAVLTLTPAVAMAQYDAVISVDPAVEGSCIAVEIPTQNGAALGGLRWFHNDGQQVFPRVVIVEGQPDTAPDLTNPGLVLDEVNGVSTGWGELTLSTPVTSSTGTAYAVFFFPESVTTHALGEGGGPGIGLKETTTDNPAFFLSADALNWARFDSSYALGVEPVYSMLRGLPRTIADLGVLIALPEQTTQEPEVALVTGMLRPHPNPFNPRVQLAYSLAAPSSMRLTVYDVRGRLVKTMVSGAQSAGEHSVMWDGVDEQGRQVASGVYFARFEAGAVVQTQRMVLLR